MNLEKLIQVILAEKNIRGVLKRVEQAPPDEIIDLYINDSPLEYRTVLRAIFYGLHQRFDFEIKGLAEGSELDNWLNTAVKDLVEYYPIDMQKTPSSTMITLPIRNCCTVEYRYGKPQQPSVMVATFSSLFNEPQNDSLREKICKYLKENGIIEIRVIPKTQERVSQAEFQRYIDALVKEISHGKGKEFIEYTVEERIVRLALKRRQIVIDLSAYNAQEMPGHFDVSEHHLFDAVGGQIKPHDRQLLDSNIDYDNPDHNEAALMTYVDVCNSFFRYVRFYLGRIAPESSIQNVLRERYERMIQQQRAEAIACVKSLAAIDFNFSDIDCSIDDEDRQGYNSEVHNKDTFTVRGILGELVGLALMYRLRKDYPVRIVAGTIDDKEPIQRLGYLIQYRKSGKNLLIANTQTYENCEIDNMMTYGGIPIIFESKTGKDISCVGYELQCKMISTLYGVPPIFVVVKIGEKRDFRALSDDRYQLTLPFKEELELKAETICTRGEKI